MTIEELKALEHKATPAPWEADGHNECWIGEEPALIYLCQYTHDADLVGKLRTLAPEILALVEAANNLNSDSACYSTHVQPVIDALDAFNEKLESL